MVSCQDVSAVDQPVERQLKRTRICRVGYLSLGILTLPSLTGCSPATVLNLLAWQRGIQISHSVPYGAGPRRTLDVYQPDAASAAPVVVFFYGGSWQSGSKRIYKFVGAALARQGYVVVIPDYRVYPETRYPGFLEDAAQALRWTKDNAARFGGDPHKLFVMGHSAGAYIAAMLVLDSRWLRAADMAPRRDISGLIGLAGPYDFLPLSDGTLRTIFGAAADTSTQPISHVSPGAPPTLLMTGANDQTVDPGNSTRLAARLRAAGDQATVQTYRGVGHLTIIGAFASPLRFFAPVLRDVDAFVVRTEAGRGAGSGVAADALDVTPGEQAR
jgi:acetyl esterase/lipase